MAGEYKRHNDDEETVIRMRTLRDAVPVVSVATLATEYAHPEAMEIRWWIQATFRRAFQRNVAMGTTVVLPFVSHTNYKLPVCGGLGRRYA